MSGGARQGFAISCEGLERVAMTWIRGMRVRWKMTIFLFLEKERMEWGAENGAICP